MRPICFARIDRAGLTTDKTLTCHCEGICPDNNTSTCQTRPGGKCFSMISEYTDDDGMPGQERLVGCMSPDENGGMFQVRIERWNWSKSK